MIESLHNSIEQIKTEDFTGEHKTNIYLDPERKVIYTFTDTGAVPANAYWGIDKCILTVFPNAISNSVYNVLLEIENDLENLVENHYLGSEHDGRNWHGKWTEESDWIMEQIDGKTIDQIAYYWEPDDWYESLMKELHDGWEAGQSPEEIVDYYGCGDELNGIVDRDSAIEWLKCRFQEWENDEVEEMENTPVTEEIIVNSYQALMDLINQNKGENKQF